MYRPYKDLFVTKNIAWLRLRALLKFRDFMSISLISMRNVHFDGFVGAVKSLKKWHIRIKLLFMINVYGEPPIMR